MSDLEIRKKQNKFDDKFIKKFYSDKTPEKEKIILVLEYLDIHIHPYSLNGRRGMKKYIKKAIKLIKKLEVLEDEK